MRLLRRIITHDWLILSLVLTNFLFIGLYLGVGPPSGAGAGYRVIDTEAVRRLLDSGDLSGREADWYHPTLPRERGH